jgi:hypothetical protein
VLARPVVGGRGNREIPWVAVATGREGGRFTLAGASDREADAALVAAARDNTVGIPWSWNVAAERGFLWFKRPSMLRAYGDLGVSATEMETDGGGVDDLSTEVLLDAAALRAAAETLRSPSIAVAVPKRGWLLACAAEPGDLGANTALLEAAAGIASRGGGHAICGSAALFVRDGVPMGYESRAAGGGAISLTGPDESAWPPG